MALEINRNDYDLIDFSDIEINMRTDTICVKSTGEIIENKDDVREILQDYSKTKAINNAKEKEIRRIAGLQEKKDYLCLNWKKDSYFIKVFRTELREYMKVTKLSTNARAFLFSVQMYIEYPTNRIAKPDGTSFTNKELQEITGLSSKTLKKVMNELEEKQFIVRKGNRQAREIYFNPYLMSSGNEILKTTKKLFDNYKPITPY